MNADNIERVRKISGSGRLEHHLDRCKKCHVSFLMKRLNFSMRIWTAGLVFAMRFIPLTKCKFFTITPYFSREKSDGAKIVSMYSMA